MEMDQTVSKPGHLPQSSGTGLVQHVRFAQLRRDLLVLRGRASESLGQNVPSEIEERLEGTTEVRLGCGWIARIGSELLEAREWQAPDAAKGARSAARRRT